MTDTLNSAEGDIIYTADDDILEPIYLSENIAICDLINTGEDTDICPIKEDDAII